MSREQGRRLQLAREHAGYRSGRMAALRLGWKYPTYAAHESGLRTYGAKVAAKYARAFGVHPDFLIYGTRPPEWWDQIATDIVEVSIPIRYMTLFSDHTADEIEQQTGDTAPMRKDYGIADTEEIPARCYAYKVVSDELLDLVPLGSVLVMERYPVVTPPGSIVLLNVKRQVPPSLRRVKLGHGGKHKYISLNENYEELEDVDARVIGRAVLHVKAL